MPITKPRQKKKDSQDNSQSVPAASRTASPAPGNQPEAKLISSRSRPQNSQNQKTVSFTERDSRKLDGSKDKLTLWSQKNSESSLKINVPIGADLHPDDKAFKIPVTFRVRHQGKYTKVAMPIGMTHGDQGSDMNLISEPLRKAMGFTVIALSSKGWSGLSMNTADGNSSPLVAYTTFMIGVNGIWRRVYAFIRPETRSNQGELSLLLGLPWLDDVDAKIHIRRSAIEIGDQSIGEKPVTIQGPLFVPSAEHRLILHPKSSTARQGPGKIPVHFPTVDSSRPIESENSGSESSDADDESEYMTDETSESESEN
jgi:hypothetical protein